MVKVTPAKLRAWRDGPEGFFKWVEDVQPRILNKYNKYEPVVLADWQKEAIRPILERTPEGECIKQTCCISWPRRHGKSYMNALIVLWRFTCWPAQNIKVLANSASQAVSTSFKIIKRIVLNTPFLLDMIGKDNLQRDRILYPLLQSEIQAVPNNENVLYGEKINLVLTTELHAARDANALGVLSSSVGDSMDGQVLIDSTTDGPSGPIAKMEEEQKKEPSIYVHRIEYKDLKDAMENAPSWIRRTWIQSQHKTLLPAFFGTQILNRRADASNCLFRVEHIKGCMDDFKNDISLDAFKALISGRKYVVGGGLDRAYGFSVHGDDTIWTATAKVAQDDGEHHYYVLNQQKIPFSMGSSIKKVIRKDHERYGMNNTCIERYESSDLLEWCSNVGIQAKMVNASSDEQKKAFTILESIVREGRLHFSKDLKGLEEEMNHIIYEILGKAIRFEAAKGFNDDRVYSLLWSIWSLGHEELAQYEIGSVQCTSKSKHARFCYLRNGDHILTCADTCPAHRAVLGMYGQFMTTKAGEEEEIPLSQFYKSKVKRTGCLVYQGV